MIAEVQADQGTITGYPYCTLVVDGCTFRITCGEYEQLHDYKDNTHDKAIELFQAIADKINE